MSKLSFKLFGVPKITKDGESVFLPYAKINALLYYMLVTKVVSRDEAVGLLWPDEDEKIAKKNLRNAIYQAKKSLGVDIIHSPKKSLLMLNETLELESDVDLFIHSPQENMHLYTGDFLQGFFLKDAESYEYWIVKMRNYYQEKFSKECYLKIEADIQDKNYAEVENHIQRLTDLDEYDERNFRLLMRFYQDTGRNSKVIETYYDLSKLLRRELGIDPDRKTKEIYERSLEQINFGDQTRSHDASFFFGRYDEIAVLEKKFKNFREKKDGTSLLITGEPGVGKSTIKRKLLEGAADDFFVLETCCYQVEQDLSLRPWCRIVREISQQIQQNRLIPPALWKDLMGRCFPDFSENLPPNSFGYRQEEASLDSLVHILIEAFTKLAAQKQVLLVLEDLQWMDRNSLRLLTAVILETDPSQVMLLATSDKARNDALTDTLASFTRYHRLITVPLERFSLEACHHFIEEALPDENLKGETLEFIYNETEGNPFFLREYMDMLKKGAKLDQMSPAMTEFLQGCFLYLSEEAMDLVYLLSIFYDAVPLTVLLKVAQKDAADVLRLLEQLKDRSLLVEKETGSDPVILFTHIKLREYAYMTQPHSRKKLLHQKVGSMLEDALSTSKKDSKLYSKLIYHFSAAGDYLKALKYQIDTLSHCLNFSHEMFPVLNTMELEPEGNRYISREQISELFRNLEISLKKVQGSILSSGDLDILEVEFFYMKGRYLIREGRYEDGVNHIMHVIDKSKQIGDQNYTLEGYKQLILYHLQVNQPKDMAEYVELALDLAVKCNYHKEIGILLRLKGLCNMMMGNYYLAEKFLTESINTLAVTENVARLYATNIAASYNYIGEIRQAEEDYQGALQLFHKAISLCLEKNVLSSLSYFYINAGKTAYYMENTAVAADYFQKAYSLYGQFDSFWRRSVLDSYMALTLMKESRYADARKYLIAARENAGYIKDPSDLGTVLFAEALIRKMADQNEEIQQIFAEDLTEPSAHYYQLALKNLSEYCNRYEIKVLTRIFAT
ncbi:MAG: AAA family ATPase [Lawsonibacter sp.]|nr:AAA family ATPase [Lawsonibacter sp.]